MYFERNSFIHDLVFSLIKIDRKHKKSIEESVARFNIHRSQHRMLLYLSSKGSSICQKRISDDLEISPAAVAKTLKKLEAMKLINRETSFDDNRYNEIAITEKGMDIVNKSRIAFSEVDKYMFSNFTDDELKTLKSLLAKADDNLNELSELKG